MTPTSYTLRAKWDELYKARLDNVTPEDLIAALQAMPHREYMAMLARERDWSGVGACMEIALRQMWSGAINAEAEEWADEQANGPLVSDKQITTPVNVPDWKM